MYVSLSASLQYNPPSSPLRLIGVIHTRSAGFNLCAQGGFRTGQCEGPCNQKDLNSWMGEGLRIYDRDLTQSHDVCEATRFPLPTRKNTNRYNTPRYIYVVVCRVRMRFPFLFVALCGPVKFSPPFFLFLFLFFLCIFFEESFLHTDGWYFSLSQRLLCRHFQNSSDDLKALQKEESV